MSVSYVADAGVASGASPRTINKPTGTAEGDVLVLGFGVDVSGATITPPTDFILVATIGGAVRSDMYYKIAGASEPASYDVSWTGGGNGVGDIACFRPTAAVDLLASATFTTDPAAVTRTWEEVNNPSANSAVVIWGLFAPSAGFSSLPTAPVNEIFDTDAVLRGYMGYDIEPDIGLTGRRYAEGAGADISRCITALFGDAIAPPSDPTDLTATALDDDQIQLSWTDNASNEDGYSIERSPNGTDSWVEIDTTAANIETYTDAGLEPETIYYYRVRAFRL